MLTYLLKCLLVFSYILNILCFLSGINYIAINHLGFSSFVFVITLFIKSFIIFFFIGLKNFLIQAVESIDQEYQEHLHEITRYYHRVTNFKKNILSWAFLNMTLLCLTSFLGASSFPRYIHKGLAMSYLTTLTIALFLETKTLTKSEKILRSTKYFLSLKDFSM